MDTRIVWFRRDLRLDDHTALHAALADAGDDTRVIPLFVWDPAITERGRISPARLAYLCEALADLDGALRDRGARLVVRHGDPAAAVTAVAGEVGATAVHWTRDVTPYARRRDDAVRSALGALDPRPLVTDHEGVAMHEPRAVLTGAGDPYKVFTPFHRQWRHLPIGVPLDPPPQIPGHGNVASDDLPTTRSLDLDAPEQRPDGGPSAARRRLAHFLQRHAAGYDDQRDVLAADATSRLSADLHFGCLSVRRVHSHLDLRNAGHKAFATELAWRDFYLHVLAAWPEVLTTEFNERYRSLPWGDDDDLVTAWKDGVTGYPIVDAGMRQLRCSGWMHNRARMIVASFLCKDLLIDWRIGEQHFLEHLVDGDLASNNGGWQWAAGTGTDAQPYFRIFNPVTQGERFDPDGAYVRRWVPELADVPDAFVHHPWDMPDDVAAACGVTVGTDYPAPIVDHGAARRRALDWFDTYRTDP
jgi:deoxyribodipyrimidine photo-lyase